MKTLATSLDHYGSVVGLTSTVARRTSSRDTI